MTTIAYKDGVIACDGRACSGDTILSDEAEKCLVRQDGVRFWFSGCNYLQDELLREWPSGKLSSNRFAAFAYSEEGLFFVSASEDGEIESCRHPLDTPFSIGSGSDHALTAMDMGASAEEAVEMAAKRDINTGGKIRVYELQISAEPKKRQESA